MRIVHQINAKAQCGIGNRGPYSCKKGERPEGFPTEVIIVSVCPITNEEEAIYIEGNAKHILHALEEISQMIRAAGAWHVEEHNMNPDWDKEDEQKD